MGRVKEKRRERRRGKKGGEKAEAEWKMEGEWATRGEGTPRCYHGTCEYSTDRITYMRPLQLLYSIYYLPTH